MGVHMRTRVHVHTHTYTFLNLVIHVHSLYLRESIFFIFAVEAKHSSLFLSIPRLQPLSLSLGLGGHFW